MVLRKQVVVEGCYELANDKIVGVNLLMAQEVVIFPVVSHFTQPLHVFLAGLRPRSARHGGGAWATGCFWTHVSSMTPPAHTAHRGRARVRGEALAGLSWRLDSLDQGGRYASTLSRQSQR